MTVGRLHHQSGLVRRSASEAGIALGPILFIIAIIAILAGVIAAGIGGFNASTSNESNKALAESIIDYAEQVKQGVNTVLANGCGDLSPSTSSISFYAPNAPSDYYNSYSPADYSCNVFDIRGGGILYKKPPSAAITAFPGGNGADYGVYAIYSYMSIQNTGINPSVNPNGSGIDLVLIVPYLTQAVCLQIDQLLGISSIPGTGWTMPLDDIGSTPHFSGSFYVGAGSQIPYSTPNGCFNSYWSNAGNLANPPFYTAYFLLQAR